VCRPLPWLSRQKPGLSDVIQRIADFSPAEAADEKKT
jgi:uncharacterized membrane protein YcjF (UPF0283 family)